MPIKIVVVSADHLQAPAGADANMPVGMVGAAVQMFNVLTRVVLNAALTAAGIAMATTTTGVKTVNTLTYRISGVFKSKGATDNFWTAAILQAATGFAAIAAGSRCLFLFCIDGSGVATVIQGPVGTTDLLITVPAETMIEDQCVVGTCKVVCGTAGFTPGTDNWNKANVTFTFSDGFDAALCGPARVHRVV